MFTVFKFKHLYPFLRQITCRKTHVNYITRYNYEFNKNNTQLSYSFDNMAKDLSTKTKFNMRHLVSILNRTDFSKVTDDQAILILKCCSNAPNSSSEFRQNIYLDIFENLKNANQFDINVFNCYLEVCTENMIYLNYKDFLNSIKCIPNQTTYKLLIGNACQVGKLDDALCILEVIKEKNIPIDVNIFNCLAMGHTIQGGLKYTNNVLKTMKSAQIIENSETKLSILRGIIRRQNLKEFTEAVELYNFEFSPHEFIVILKELGYVAKEDWLVKIENLYKHISFSRELQAKIENMCIHLVYMKRPLTAINIYKQFVKPVPDGSYAYNILKEMLHCKIDIDTVISIAQKLEQEGLNYYILQDLTGLSLKCKYIEDAWALLDTLKTHRSHYFWPFFIHYGQNNGERGVFYVLKRMRDYNVTADAESIEDFILPHCDFSNARMLISKFQTFGLTIGAILNPLIIVLLKRNQVDIASKLCDLYSCKITEEKILQLLPKSWFYSKNYSAIVNILRKFRESSIDVDDCIGHFLLDSYRFCKCEQDNQDFYNLVQVLAENKLNISTHYAATLQYSIKEFKNSKQQIMEGINSIIDLGKKINEETVFTHPKNMDIDSLECHLIELEEKNMNRRGLIRKLIQYHSSKRNLNRVRELMTKFSNLGYESSTGMKSSVMHCFIVEEQVDDALEYYRAIKHDDPNFQLDSFKLIDLAALLLKSDRFENAFNILQSESFTSHLSGNKYIQKNCRKLLNSCQDSEQIEKLLKLLFEKNICSPTNVIMGPLVRIHLKRGDVGKAVETYIKLAEKYKCTPLQLEILCEVLKEGNNIMLQQVLAATEQVHGPGPARVGLIAALAENNEISELRKALSGTTVSINNLLHKRCHRWVEEKKGKPLLCLAKACNGLSDAHIDRNILYKSILDVYAFYNDYEGALEFFESLPKNYISNPAYTKYIEKMRCNNERQLQLK